MSTILIFFKNLEKVNNFFKNSQTFRLFLCFSMHAPPSLKRARSIICRLKKTCYHAKNGKIVNETSALLSLRHSLEAINYEYVIIYKLLVLENSLSVRLCKHKLQIKFQRYSLYIQAYTANVCETRTKSIKIVQIVQCLNRRI